MYAISWLTGLFGSRSCSLEVDFWRTIFLDDAIAGSLESLLESGEFFVFSSYDYGVPIAFS